MKTLTDISCSAKYRWIPPALWLLAVAVSLFWNINALDRERENNALQSARSFFHLIVTATSWDIGTDAEPASSGTVSANTSPHLARIDANNNIELTHSYPAFMARLLSEITSKKNGVVFRITSLRHTSLSNKADIWEQKALQSFEEGLPEFSAYIHDGTERRYHYMAPVFTTESCLRCHKQQGYEEGDIRGGISIILPPEKIQINWPLFLSHGLAAVIGIILFRLFSCQLLRAEEKMELLASRDSLTGVANRRFFQEYLQREWYRAKRNTNSLSLLMCDIDCFKQYNKTYGLRAGDNCLSQVAYALTSALNRPGDFIARYGGVKFAIILPETTLSGAETLGKIILNVVENLKIEHIHSEAGKYVTVSIGITDNANLSTPNEIVSQANKALLRAKEQGRNRLVCLPHKEEQHPS
jgi:diguanylate cyclase (GGDEF)-like protein